MGFMLASVGRDSFNGAVVSDDGIGALDDVIGFFIEVKIVGSNASVDTGLVKVTFNHCEE